MPTTTPKSAAEARALADQLDAEERDLNQRRAVARKAAEIDTCRDLLGAEADRLRAEATAANDAWVAAKSDPSVGLDDLFELWQTLRTASARRATHVRQLNARLGSLEPLHHPTSGQPIGHRGDLYDPMEPRGELTFAYALEEVLSIRVRNASTAIDMGVGQRVLAASDEAAEAIA